MKVNGVDISIFEAKQAKVTPGKRTVVNESEAAGGFPLLLPPQFGLRTYQIILSVHGETREKKWENTDGILNLFRGVSDVKLDGFEHDFKLSLSSVQHDEYGPGMNRWHVLKLECVGCEYGPVHEFSVLSDVFEFYKVNYPDTVKSSLEFDLAEKLAEFGDANITPVPLGIKIEQIRKAEDTEESSELDFRQGHAIWGKLEISGFCRNLQGKDMGSICVKDETGATTVMIQGDTGRVRAYDYYGKEIRSYDTGFPYISIPCMPVCGFAGQPIKINMELTAGTQELWVRYKQLKFSFSYARMYL